MGLYILQGRESVPVDDPLVWGRWFKQADRHVGLATWRDAAGAEVARVSTVFLGLDHGWHGVPQLFETLIFWATNPQVDQSMTRCATWEQAEQQHEAACALVRAELGAPS